MLQGKLARRGLLEQAKTASCWVLQRANVGWCCSSSTSGRRCATAASTRCRGPSWRRTPAVRCWPTPRSASWSSSGLVLVAIGFRHLEFEPPLEKNLTPSWPAFGEPVGTHMSITYTPCRLVNGVTCPVLSCVMGPFCMELDAVFFVTDSSDA